MEKITFKEFKIEIFSLFYRENRFLTEKKYYIFIKHENIYIPIVKSTFQMFKIEIFYKFIGRNKTNDKQISGFCGKQIFYRKSALYQF